MISVNITLMNVACLMLLYDFRGFGIDHKSYSLLLWYFGAFEYFLKCESLIAWLGTTLKWDTDDTLTVTHSF